jgi:tyrosyl-tRNA synthetase
MYSKIAMADFGDHYYYELLTDIPMEEITALTPSRRNKTQPYDITRQLHGELGAQGGQKYFEDFVQTKTAPTDTPTISVKTGTPILEVLKSADLGVSNSISAHARTGRRSRWNT